MNLIAVHGSPPRGDQWINDQWVDAPWSAPEQTDTSFWVKLLIWGWLYFNHWIVFIWFNKLLNNFFNKQLCVLQLTPPIRSAVAFALLLLLPELLSFVAEMCGVACIKSWKKKTSRGEKIEVPNKSSRLGLPKEQHIQHLSPEESKLVRPHSSLLGIILAQNKMLKLLSEWYKQQQSGPGSVAQQN